MAEQEIEFRKIREFGDNLSDTFLFIRKNIRPLLISVLAICGVIMLAQAIFNGIYQSRLFSVFDQFRRGIYDSQYRNFSNIFTMEYFLSILCAWLTHISMQTTLAAFIKLYVGQGNVVPSVEHVWEVFRRNFLKVFFYTIPVFLLTIVGFIFCIAPGVFLAVVLIPFPMILVIEDRGFGYAFNRCFEIIKDNFWISLGTYIVSGMIYYFSVLVVSAVVGMVIGLMTFLTTRSLGTTAGILTSVLNVFSGTFYIIFFVSAAFQYYNLVERRDGTGILQRIDKIGSPGDNFDNIDKQY
jgi:hypothetical protein